MVLLNNFFRRGKDISLRRIIFLILLGFIYSVPVSWLSCQGKCAQVSLEEQRELVGFPSWKDYQKAFKQSMIGNTTAANNLIQANVENAVIDQFPLRFNFMQVERVIERWIIGLSYSMVSDPIIPASMRSPEYLELPFFVNREGSRLVYPPIMYDDQVEKGIYLRIDNYRNLLNVFPKQHLYIFYVDRIGNSKYNPLNSNFPDADAGRSFEYFQRKLPPGIGLSGLMLGNYQDYVENFFNTDHHWNIRGAWKGYEEIYKMLAPNYPGISPELTLQGTHLVPGVKFLGSLARQSLYPILPDQFEIADVKLQPYELYINRNNVPFKNKYAELAKNASFEKYFNYYDAIYLQDVNLKEYSFHNNASRNLLIIGNSFADSMEVYVASHYWHTYSIELKNFKDFSLGDFINKYKIDDVLILGDAELVYGRKTPTINP
jgi:hypothetical protein